MFLLGYELCVLQGSYEPFTLVSLHALCSISNRISIESESVSFFVVDSSSAISVIDSDLEKFVCIDEADYWRE